MIKSLYSGVSGLTTHQVKMDVIGNNIANVNTFGFKASRTVFSDMFYQPKSSANSGSANDAGNNPASVGAGVKLTAIDRDMSQSNYQSTNRLLDLFLSGDGFFATATFSDIDFDASAIPTYDKAADTSPTKDMNYTRAGNFGIDSFGNLVTNNNRFVMGMNNTPRGLAYINDDSIQELAKQELTDVNGDGAVTASDYTYENTINVNKLVQEAFNIHMDSNGVKYMKAYIDPDFPVLPDGASEETAVTLATAVVEAEEALEEAQAAYDKLVEKEEDLIEKRSETAEEIRVAMATIAKALGTSTTATQDQKDDVTDAIAAIEQAIMDAAAAPDAGEWDDLASTDAGDLIGTLNAAIDTVEAADGGNDALKEAQALLKSAATVMTRTQKDYTTVSTQVDEQAPDETTSKIYLAQEALTTAETALNDNTDTAGMSASDVLVATTMGKNGIVPKGANFEFVEPVFNEDGTINTDEVTEIYFLCDELGQPLMTEPTKESENQGNYLIHYIPDSDLADPRITPADFMQKQSNNEIYGVIPEPKMGEFTYADLAEFDISNGVLMATLNGQKKAIARLDVAVFDNPEGLAEGTNAETSASGVAKIKKPGDAGAAKIETNGLEMANVDLSREFSDMIITQRGFQANARIITTSDTMLEELINLKR